MHENASPESANVLSQMHPDIAVQCIEAASLLAMDVATLKLQAADIGISLEEQKGSLVSIQPGMAQEGPLACPPIFANYGQAVIERLFPAGKDGRIPIVAVTGVNGKTTTTRLIAWLIESLALCVGSTCTDGVFVDGRNIDTGDCSGPKRPAKSSLTRRRRPPCWRPPAAEFCAKVSVSIAATWRLSRMLPTAITWAFLGSKRPKTSPVSNGSSSTQWRRPVLPF